MRRKNPDTLQETEAEMHPVKKPAVGAADKALRAVVAASATLGAGYGAMQVYRLFNHATAGLEPVREVRRTVNRTPGYLLQYALPYDDKATGQLAQTPFVSVLNDPEAFATEPDRHIFDIHAILRDTSAPFIAYYGKGSMEDVRNEPSVPHDRSCEAQKIPAEEAEMHLRIIPRATLQLIADEVAALAKQQNFSGVPQLWLKLSDSEKNATMTDAWQLVISSGALLRNDLGEMLFMAVHEQGHASIASGGGPLSDAHAVIKAVPYLALEADKHVECQAAESESSSVATNLKQLALEKLQPVVLAANPASQYFEFLADDKVVDQCNPELIAGAQRYFGITDKQLAEYDPTTRKPRERLKQALMYAHPPGIERVRRMKESFAERCTEEDLQASIPTR
jgi:hypothetical protein